MTITEEPIATTVGKQDEYYRRIVREWSVTTGDGCWMWQRAIFNGYGRLKYRGVNRTAHWVAYNVFVEPLGHDQRLRHTCGHRACVNPAHLIRRGNHAVGV